MKKENTIRRDGRIYILYIVGTIIIILSIFLSIKQSVMGREQRKQMNLILSVDQEEQIYIQSIKGELSKRGFPNCGVTMTKTVDGDGKFYYSVLIHHRNFDEVGLEQKNAIFYSLKNLPNEIKKILNAEDITKEVCFIYEII